MFCRVVQCTDLYLLQQTAQVAEFCPCNFAHQLHFIWAIVTVSSGTTVTVKCPGTRMLNTISALDTKLGFSGVLLVVALWW